MPEDAIDLDAFILRLVLNSALMDKAPDLVEETTRVKYGMTGRGGHDGNGPQVVKPYWEGVAGDAWPPFVPTHIETSPSRGGEKTTRPTTTTQTTTGLMERERSSGSGGDPVVDSAGIYEDVVRYQAAQIIQRANRMQAEEERKMSKGGKDLLRRTSTSSSSGRRRKLLDRQEEEDTTTFQEHYARFICRLSHVNRQYIDTDLAEYRGTQKGKENEIAMALSLSESLREVFTDPVITDLVKESTLTRLRARRQKLGPSTCLYE